MHRCDVRKAFRRLGCAKVGCACPPLGTRHTPHTCYEDRSVGGVLLSHNPTIAVPSAQSNLATGIGTGPGVPLTLKPPTQTHLKQQSPPAPYRVRAACCVKHCTTNTNTTISFFAATLALGATILLFSSPTRENTRCFLCRCISTSHLQHVTMLTALAYQPHHLQGTSTETSSQNRLPA